MKCLSREKIFHNYSTLYFSVAVALLLLYWMCFAVNQYLAASIYDGAFYRFLIPVLFGSYIALKGFRGETQIRVLLIYWTWAIVTRLLNGDPTLTDSLPRILDLTLMVLCFIPGLILEEQLRELFYSGIAVIICVFYFLLGIMCIYSGVTREILINPLDGVGAIGYLNPKIDRLYVLGLHPNSVAGQFLVSFCLLVFLFIKYKNLIARIWFSLAAVIDYVVIAMTISRNGQTFQSLSLALAVAIVALSHVKEKQIWKKTATIFVLLLALSIIFYQGYEPVRYAVWSTHEKLFAGEPVRAVSESLPSQTNSAVSEYDIVYQADERGYFESGRKEIYRSAFTSLKQEPWRLLIGSSYEHYMDISHNSIRERALNFHNMIFEIVNLFGLPALGLVICFYIILAKYMLFMVFDQSGLFALSEKMLVLPVIALTGHFMLEAGAFTDVNFRVGFLFFSAGMITGIVNGRKGSHLRARPCRAS